MKSSFDKKRKRLKEREREKENRCSSWVGGGDRILAIMHKHRFFTLLGMVMMGSHVANPTRRGSNHADLFLIPVTHAPMVVGLLLQMFSIQDFSRRSSHHPEHRPVSWQRTPRPWWSSNRAPNGLARIGPHIASAEANLMATTHFQPMKEILSTQKESQNICEQPPINVVSFCSNPNIKSYYSGYSLWGILTRYLRNSSRHCHREFILWSWNTRRDLFAHKGFQI